MKLYTKSGDDGTTGLFGGDRVGKDHPRVEAYGTVDELNAAIGLAAAACAGEGFPQRCGTLLHGIQSELFDLGADLATPPGSEHEDRVQRIDERMVTAVETLIDETEAANTPLQAFILPGGCELACRLHLARGICRRAERRVVNLARSAPVGQPVLQYLNRVGDLLFALARRANGDAGVPDVPWKGAERRER